MATVQDAIELLQDPANVRHVDGGSREVLAVKAEQVARLLGVRGAANRHEAIALIRQAASALGGGEVLVRKRGALELEKTGSGQRTAAPAFWIPVG